jgi:prolipoprotein diacylglyceryl transferase
MLNYIHWDIDPEIFNIGSLSIRYYSLLFIGGLLISFYILKYIYQKEKIDVELLDKLFVYVGIGIVAGARIGHCIFYEWHYYQDHLLEIILPVTFGEDGMEFTGFRGLASHGAMIGMTLAVWLYSYKTKESFLKTFDKIAIIGPLAGAFIRFGNLMNSEILGKITDSPLGFVFSRVDTQIRHAAQLYEALAYLISFIILWWSYKKFKSKVKSGFFLSLTMVLTFSARFFIEFAKENQEAFEDSMTLNMGQWLSIPIVIIGIWLMIKTFKVKKVEE